MGFSIDFVVFVPDRVAPAPPGDDRPGRISSAALDLSRVMRVVRGL
jgi:hypothetical protein